jgi:hypothetical protein
MQGLLHKIEEKAQASGLMKHQQAGTTTGQPTGDVTTTTATGKPGLSSQLSQLAYVLPASKQSIQFLALILNRMLL